MTNLTMQQACVHYPEAMVLFDYQCPHLASAEDTYFVEDYDVLKSGICRTLWARSRVLSPYTSCHYSVGHRNLRTGSDWVGARWHSEVGTWIRFSALIWTSW